MKKFVSGKDWWARDESGSWFIWDARSSTWEERPDPPPPDSLRPASSPRSLSKGVWLSDGLVIAGATIVIVLAYIAILLITGGAGLYLFVVVGVIAAMTAVVYLINSVNPLIVIGLGSLGIGYAVAELADFALYWPGGGGGVGTWLAASALTFVFLSLAANRMFRPW